VNPTDPEPFDAAGGPIGVVVCHGFTGMPGSVRPWAEALAEAGHMVKVPRLPGHGTTWQDANASTYEQWYGELEAAFDAVRAECEQTFVAGLSMGGTLTLRLAEQRGNDVAGLVVVNPSLFTTRKDAKLLPMLRRVVPSLPPVGNDIKKAGVTEPAYDRTPVRAAYQLSRLWAITNAHLDLVTQPILVLTSRDDHLVEPANSARVMASVSSADKQQIWLEDSFHVATLDNDLPVIIEETLTFIKAHS